MATRAHKAKHRPIRKAKLPPKVIDDKKGVPEAPKRLVLFVHGIRDPGFWTEKLQSLFIEQGFVAKAIGYGVFDAFRFLLGFRRRPTTIVKQQIVNAISDDENKGAEVTIIAHSFGTYIVSRILDDDPSVKITRLVMCGGIVRQDFRWDKVARLNVQKPGTRVQIINENSARDIWPIMARHATYGFGDCGSTGCANRADVQNRLHDIPHSAYLNLAFAKQFWIPPIVHGLKLEFPNVTTRPPWFFFLTKSPFTIISAVILGLVLLGAFTTADRIGYTTAGQYEYPKGQDIKFEIAGYRDNFDQSPQYMYSRPNHKYKFKRFLLTDRRFGKIEVTIGNRPLFQCEDDINNRLAKRQGPLESIHQNDSGVITNILEAAVSLRQAELARNESANGGVSESDLRKGEIEHREAIKKFFNIVETEDKKQFFAETKFTLDFSDAYRTFGESKLQFEYKVDATVKVDDKIKSQPADKLIVKAGEGLDFSRIKVIAVEHDDNKEKCLDLAVTDGTSPFFEKQEIPSKTGWLSWFLSVVWAQDAPQSITQSDIINFLGSNDPASRAIATQAISAAPQSYALTVKKIIADPKNSAEMVADAIRASRNALPSPIALDADILIGLAHAGPPLVRDAARSYLRAPGVVSSDLARKFSGAGFELKVKELRTKLVKGSTVKYFQDYLLLITARDVFYNLGLSELTPYLEKIRKNEPASLDGVLAPFDSGMKLAALTNEPDEKVALAKNTYGKGLVLLEAAINKEAANSTDYKDVFQFIDDARLKFKTIDDKIAAKKIVEQFGMFLTAVEGKENLYPWPFHIAQAKRCAKALTYACLSFEVPEAL